MSGIHFIRPSVHARVLYRPRRPRSDGSTLYVAHGLNIQANSKTINHIASSIVSFVVLKHNSIRTNRTITYINAPYARDGHLFDWFTERQNVNAWALKQTNSCDSTKEETCLVTVLHTLSLIYWLSSLFLRYETNSWSLSDNQFSQSDLSKNARVDSFPGKWAGKTQPQTEEKPMGKTRRIAKACRSRCTGVLYQQLDVGCGSLVTIFGRSLCNWVNHYRDFQKTRTYVDIRYMLSPVRLSSVTFVRSTQPVEIFGNISTPFGTFGISWLSRKILRRSYQGTAVMGEGLNARRVANYSDFGPIEGYILETVQDRR